MSHIWLVHTWCQFTSSWSSLVVMVSISNLKSHKRFINLHSSGIVLGNFGDDGGELEKVGRRYNIPVLFGIVEPGLLYNAKLDAPLWGKSLFPNLTCHEEWTVHVDAEIFTEYSVLERLDHFSIDASLSLSFLAGLIKVSSTVRCMS